MQPTTLFTTLLTLALGALHVSAHAMPNPALGITGRALQCNDTLRPSDNKPCGNVDIASNIDKAMAIPVTVGKDGTSVSFNMTSFNGGRDGSRKVSVMIDPTGTEKSFVKADVTKNGDPAPKEDTGSDLITVALPDGTKCTGGKDKNLCLLSVKSTAGFGACTVASQLDTSSSTGTGAMKNGKIPCKSSKKNRRAVATRAARFLRAQARELEREAEMQERSLHGNPLFATTLL
ncbi:hypothetical protein R3P38DRAFT_3508058 [Favolaschia claudopus]|uniref:Uncharacterized protein n=1 Tax=Favolaschia claudopus TaxID=2862362 RepID=A0AAW0C0L6_9AGAR